MFESVIVMSGYYRLLQNIAGILTCNFQYRLFRASLRYDVLNSAWAAK